MADRLPENELIATARALVTQGDIISVAQFLSQRRTALSALAEIRALLEDPSYEVGNLTPQQREVYALIVRGYNTTEIGAIKDMAVSQVKHQARVIQERLSAPGLDGIRKHYFSRLSAAASRTSVRP